ncbi:sugar/nucleoside kinase (ribokinase family) [Arthrobacter sp. W4I7]|nr:sugar/nucleoside kinase (ribokinase family) [Arthrobacter sp. W4I7]
MLTTHCAQVAVPPIRSAVVDTIGAGDSYMSALIYGLLMRGADGLAPSVLDSLGRMASKAAAITVRRPGARPPMSEEPRAELPEHQPVAQ